MPLAMAKKCERLGQKNTRRAMSLSPSVWLTLLVMAIYFASAWLTLSLLSCSITHSPLSFLYKSLSLQLKNIFVMVTQHLYPYIPCFFFQSSDFCHPLSNSQVVLPPLTPSFLPTRFRFYLHFHLLSRSSFSYEKLPAVNLSGPVVKRWNYGKLL